ncbi:serine O-acetyltransferase [Streptomyces sp. NPDC003042]
MSRREITLRTIARDLSGVWQHAGGPHDLVVPEGVMRPLLGRISAQVSEDLAAFAQRDAAARGEEAYIYSSYLAFRAVMAYRLAHAVWALDASRGLSGELAVRARCISERFRLATGVEIHPGAVIGRRFVVDHGLGTVIGEESVIGDDCYFVESVVLGARDIVARAPGGVQPRRHPRIGHRVQIGGDVHVFGPVTVGDDCLIDPGARITCDVPAGSRVRVISTIQVSCRAHAPTVDGVACVEGLVVITGSGLMGLRPAVVDEAGVPQAFLTVVTAGDGEIRCAPRPASPGHELGLLRDRDVVSLIRPMPSLLRAVGGEPSRTRVLLVP